MKYYKDEKPINLVEKQLKSESVFKGHFLKVQRDQVELPDGKTAGREFIRHPGASLIIPVLDNGNLMLVEQFRYPLQKIFLEFPAGKKDSGETTLQTAQRELREEVGFETSKIEFLHRMHLAIGYSDEFIDVFVAENLKEVGVQRDEGEFLNRIEISLEEALDLFHQGQLTDSKTSVALLAYSQWLVRRSSK